MELNEAFETIENYGKKENELEVLKFIEEIKKILKMKETLKNKIDNILSDKIENKENL